MFRSRILRIARSPLTRPGGTRSNLHTMPKLPHDFSEGVPELLSDGAVMLSWTRYQAMLLQRLNDLTVGTELEQFSTIQVIAETARKPMKAHIFNYASMAHNNHFFFRDLAPAPTPIPHTFQKRLEETFGSMETLRREMIMTANAMFGPGFVWLVLKNKTELSVMSTYLAGSPYPQAHWRMQKTDMNTTGADRSAEHWMKHTQARGIPNTNNRRDEQGPLDDQPTTLSPFALPTGGTSITPLLCVNTWEHVWLPDYGFEVGDTGGKRMFLEKWWAAIDWETVAQRANASWAHPPQTKLEQIARSASQNQRRPGESREAPRGSLLGDDPAAAYYADMAPRNRNPGR